MERKTSPARAGRAGKSLLVAAVAAVCLSWGAPAGAEEPAAGVFPSPDEWLAHAKTLEKFWLMPDARGNPVGRFPTWRCDDGTLPPAGSACEEKGKPAGAGKHKDFGKLTARDYVRMMSRQTYGYGALFNLTGNPEDLALHKAGVDFLVKYARDPEGGFYTFFEGDKGLPARNARTPQDLAYALAGLAMNAYLTGDPEIIGVIAEAEKYIFKTYYDPEREIFRWNTEAFEEDTPDRLDLVAGLDQLNAYMLLTWRLLPPELRKGWAADVETVVKSLNRHYYNEEEQRFYGCIENKECLVDGVARNSDYGHSIKSLWMEYLAGCGLGLKAMTDFARDGMTAVLGKALSAARYNPKTGETGDLPDSPDLRDPYGKPYEFWHDSVRGNMASWWIWAELDQAAMTMALVAGREMPNTLRTFFTFEDRDYGEIKMGRKQGMWRSAYHSTEHALVGYILSNALNAREKCAASDAECLDGYAVKLYFAPKDPDAKKFTATPYLYAGKAGAPEAVGNGVVRYTFTDIRPPLRVGDGK